MQSKFVDVDGHILESPNLWAEYLEPKYKDRALRLRKDEKGLEYLEIDGKKSWFMRGGTLGLIGGYGKDPKPFLEPGKIDYADARKDQVGSFDPDARIKIMDKEGIDISIIYPSLGLCWESECKDPELSAALCRAYNNWLFDFCKPHPSRLIAAAHIPMRDVGEAVKELRRCAKLGAKAAMVNSYLAGAPAYGSSYYDPLWAEAQELDIPITLHASNADDWAGSKYYPNVGDMPTWYTFVTSIQDLQLNITTLFGEGTFEKFPRLKVVILEAGCGWLRTWLDRMDDVYKLFHFTTKMKLKPSEYFERQCWISMNVEEGFAPEIIKTVGAHKFVWAFDYPHSDGGLDPLKHLKKTLEKLPKDDQHKVFGANAMNLYKL